MSNSKPFKCHVYTGIPPTSFGKPTEVKKLGPYWRRGSDPKSVKLALREEFSNLEVGHRRITKVTASTVKEDIFMRAIAKNGEATMLPGLDLNTGLGEPPPPVVDWRGRGKANGE